MQQCFSAWFFLWFSQKLSFFILFFNIELVKNYSYNMWGKHCNFPQKLLLIATMFFPTLFFLLIATLLRIAIIIKYKFFITKHYGLIQFFLTRFFFSSFFCVFFCNIFFPKLSLSILFFLILSWLEFNFVINLNHVGKAL